MDKCSRSECDKPVFNKRTGWCGMHYNRHRLGKDMDAPPQVQGGSVESRFWDKVDRQSDDECWEWKAYRNRQGYGGFEVWVPEQKRGKSVPAHRLAYELHHGEPPKGIVCHTCDNPSCCNPAHLYDGTHESNAQDRETRGRNGWVRGNYSQRNTARGSRSGRTNLTEDSVREIRGLYASGEYTQNRLAEMFQVGQSRISGIVRRETWKHVD